MEAKWKKRRSYGVLGLCYFIGGVEYAVILPTLWLYIKTDFEAKEYMLGMLLSGYSFAAIISGPLWGRWADKSRKPKLIISLGVLFQVIGNIMYFMGISVWFLLGSRLVAGIGGGAEAVIMAEVTRTSEEKSRTGIISTLVAVRQLGLIIGPGLNLFLRELNFYVDGFYVNKYNVPGAFMACIWMVFFFLFVSLYTDLHKLKKVSEKKRSSPKVKRSRSDEVVQGHAIDHTDYDEDFYKEILPGPSDTKSINSQASSRSGTNDPDELMETAEDFMNEEFKDSRAFSPDRRCHRNARQTSMNGLSSGKTIDGHTNMEDGGYGAIENGIMDERRSRNGSQDYIDSTEEGLVDYLHGKSKLKFMYHEYIREEIVTVIAVNFNSYFNQLALETMVTPLSLRLLNWGELENSIMYCLAGVEVILVFGIVTWLSKRLQDRVLIVIGSVILAIANSWLIFVVPRAQQYTPAENIWKFIIGIILDMFALPFLVSASISLYSKITRKETQGLSMGLRRSVIGLATILGPLWAGSTITMPYIMFGAMLGLLAISLVMLLASFSKLLPASELPLNRAGLITEEDPDLDIETKPLLS
ncbi:hypothetical protein ACF0H5_019251 [Mactra antiquata]